MRAIEAGFDHHTVKPPNLNHLRELLSSAAHEYVLVADERPWDPSIKPWTVEDKARFIPATCHRLISPFLFQKGLIRLGLRRDIEAIIYLGNPYFVSTWISALAERPMSVSVLHRSYLRPSSRP